MLARILNVAFISIGLALPFSAFAADLTEESVRQAIIKIDNAANAKNVGSIASSLSDNIDITINITSQGNKQVLTPSKQEYIAMLQQGWAVAKNYKYSRYNLKIKIQNNKAFVSGRVKESMTIQGQNISGESNEEGTVELIDGKLLVTKITAHTSM